MDVKLLLKRLKIIGLPIDLVNLIGIWLTVQYLYVKVGVLYSTINENQKQEKLLNLFI